MLTYEPGQRISAKQALSQPYFSHRGVRPKVQSSLTPTNFEEIASNKGNAAIE